MTEASGSDIQEEIVRITQLLSARLGRNSRWNGRVGLAQEGNFFGKKLFSCGIVIQARLVRQDVRWRTLIHESLHAFSAGYVSSDYNALLGWEEGVVEQLQRLLRREILSQMAVSVEEQVFRAVEDGHVYNRYITALEDLRLAAGDRHDPVPFYQNLLATPVNQRVGLAYGLGSGLAGKDRQRFVSVLATATDRLRTKVIRP